MSNYWKPQYKFQLVEWLTNYHKNTTRGYWSRMSKKQLYGVYCEIRNKE